MSFQFEQSNIFSGDSYHSLMYLFRIPVCTISRIIPEVCSAIYNVLKEEFLLSTSKYIKHIFIKTITLYFEVSRRCFVILCKSTFRT